MSFILEFTQAGVTTFYATIVLPLLFSSDLDELENWPRGEMGGGGLVPPPVHPVAPPLTESLQKLNRNLPDTFGGTMYDFPVSTPIIACKLHKLFQHEQLVKLKRCEHTGCIKKSQS